MRARKAICSLLAGLATSSVAQAVIIGNVNNGGFESGAFAPGWTSLGDNSIQMASFGITPFEGSRHAVIRSGTGSQSDTNIQNFLGLPASSLDAMGNGNAIEASAIKQTITVGPDEVLNFNWNFGSFEYYPPAGQNDFAFLAVIGESSHQLIELTDRFSAQFTGSGAPGFLLQTGYQDGFYAFPEPGTYTIAFGVADVGSTAASSGLMIDAVTIAVPDPTVAAGLALLGGVGTLLRPRRRA